MRSRLARFGVVVGLVGLVGLPGTAAPPASADSAGSINIVGAATLSGGLGYATPTNLPTARAPVFDCLRLPGDQGIPKPENCHPEYDHLRNVVGIASTTCATFGLTVNKANKAPGFAGLCQVTRVDNPAKPTPPENTVSGHCGLSGGQVTVSVTIGEQRYFADIHFTGVGGNLVLGGHWWKGAIGTTSNHGLVIGAATAVPDPDGTTGSCTNKTATRFLLTATASIVPDPAL